MLADIPQLSFHRHLCAPFVIKKAQGLTLLSMPETLPSPTKLRMTVGIIFFPLLLYLIFICEKCCISVKGVEI